MPAVVVPVVPPMHGPSGAPWRVRGMLPECGGHPRMRHSPIRDDVAGGTDGDTVMQVKLADSAKSPPAELLAGLATTLDSAAVRRADDAGPVFVFAEP